MVGIKILLQFLLNACPYANRCFSHGVGEATTIALFSPEFHSVLKIEGYVA